MVLPRKILYLISCIGNVKILINTPCFKSRYNLQLLFIIMDFFSWILSLFGLSVSPEYLIKKGAGQAAKGNISAAVEHYKKAINIDPHSSGAYDGLGRVYFQMDLREQAAREFAIADGLEALSRNPDDLYAALKTGQALMSKSNHDLARNCLQPLFKLNPNNVKLLKALGSCYKSLNENENALSYFNAAVRLDHHDPELYLKLGELELASGNNDTGKWFMDMSRNLNQAKDDSTDTASRYGIASLYIQKKQFQTALPFIIKTVEIDPKFVDGWLALSEVYKNLDQPQPGISAIEQVIKINPEDPEPHLRLADFYVQAGEISKARSIRETAQILQSGMDGANNAKQAGKYIKYLFHQGKTDKAQDQLAGARTRWPDDIFLKFLEGRICFQQERFDEALKLMQDVVKENEKLVEPHIFLALAYNRLGQNMAALAEGQLSTKLAPQNAHVHQVLGDIYRKQKKFSLAATSYETAERLRGSKDS